MSDVFFTTNPAEYTKLEGLYISEKNPPGFIRGRDLSIVGMATRCVRGPTDVQLVSSVGRFLEIYGGRDYGGGGTLIGQGWKALLNKPFGTVAIRRVVSSTAVKASFTVETAAGGAGTAIARIDAANPGLWGNDVQFKVENATDGVATKWNLRVKYLGREYLFENLNTQAGQDNLAIVIGDDPGTLVRVTKLADGRPVNNAAGVDGADTLGFVNLGETVAAHTSVAGTEPALTATDYINGFNDLAAYEGLSVVLVPESLEETVGVGAQATLNAQFVVQAAAVFDRMFLTWSGETGNAPAADITDMTTQITTRSDRLVWCYNTSYVLDPTNGVAITQGPHVWLASILSQNDVDVHPGAQQTARQTAGVNKLAQQSLSRGDLILLRNAGISTLERLHGAFLFRSGVTTDLTTGKTEIARRRMTDFLQLSASDRLRYFVKERNTIELRAQVAGELVAFSQSLKDQGRIVEDFAIEQDSVNTAAQRAQGVEKIFWRVKIIGHVLHLVMETEIGTGVVIEAAA